MCISHVSSVRPRPSHVHLWPTDEVLPIGAFYLANVGTLIHGMWQVYWNSCSADGGDLCTGRTGVVVVRQKSNFTETPSHLISQAKAIYVPELFLCGASNTVASRINVTTSFAFDLTCLITMLLILMRSRGSGFWKFLVQQGIVYFMVATASYLLPTVCALIPLLTDQLTR